MPAMTDTDVYIRLASLNVMIANLVLRSHAIRPWPDEIRRMEGLTRAAIRRLVRYRAAANMVDAQRLTEAAAGLLVVQGVLRRALGTVH